MNANIKKFGIPETTKIEDILVSLRSYSKSLKFFSFKLIKLDFDPDLIEMFEAFYSTIHKFPIKVKPDSEFYTFEGFIFTAENQKASLSHIIRTITSSYLLKTSEKIEALSYQALEGIKKMGFGNTKTQKDKAKHLFLYAINDYSNDCKPEWGTFPFILTVKEKLLDFKVIFAVECKPGIFSDKAAEEGGNLSKSTAVNTSLIAENDQRRINISSNSSKMGMNNYLNDEKDEFKPVVSKFQQLSEQISGLNQEKAPNEYLNMVFDMIKFSNKSLNNWKFVFDKVKKQVYMRLTMRPLYPYSNNKLIPQLLTSEAIIYYTSYAYALYEIYNCSKLNKSLKNPKEYRTFLKNLKKICKKRSKKPIIQFTLIDNSSETMKKVEFRGNYKKESKIKTKLESEKIFCDIFMTKRIEFKDQKISYPKILYTQGYKIFNFERKFLKYKSLKKFKSLIQILKNEKYYLDIEKISDSFLEKKGKLFCTYKYPLSGLVVKCKESHRLMQKTEEILSMILKFLQKVKFKGVKVFTPKSSIVFENGQNYLYGSPIEIVNIKDVLKQSEVKSSKLNELASKLEHKKNKEKSKKETEETILLNLTVKKYTLNRYLFEGFTRRYISLLKPGKLIVQKFDCSGIEERRSLFERKSKEKFQKNFDRFFMLFKSYRNKSIYILPENVFVNEKSESFFKLDLSSELEYRVMGESLDESRIFKNREGISFEISEFILQFLIELGKKIINQFELNLELGSKAIMDIVWSRDELIDFEYKNGDNTLLFKLPLKYAEIIKR